MNEYFLDRLVEAIPMLRRTCYRYVVDSNRADDLVQETLLKAIYNSDRYVRKRKVPRMAIGYHGKHIRELPQGGCTHGHRHRLLD